MYTVTFKKVMKKDLGNRMTILTSVPRKITEQVLMEAPSKNKHNRKVSGNSQHRFANGKSCVTNPPSAVR